MIAFDIETGPLERDIVLARVKDFEPPEHPGEFDPSTVKTGNMKPETAEKKIESKRIEHIKLIASYESDIAAAKEEYEREAMERAALSPLTGEIVAIGYKSEKGSVHHISAEDFDHTEEELICKFWAKYRSCSRAPIRRMVGHNIFGFDLPFLIRRSWILDIPVPQGVIDRDRFWNERVFVDTMKKWQCGVYGGDWVKLDTLSQAIGGTGKPEGVTGAMFADLITGSAEEQKQAVEYLENDLLMTWNVAVALGVR